VYGTPVADETNRPTRAPNFGQPRSSSLSITFKHITVKEQRRHYMRSKIRPSIYLPALYTQHAPQ
jgi:hypothetical protein